MSIKIGALAVQGDFAAHISALAKAGVECIEVKKSGDLIGVQGLIIPGGESTTMLKFLDEDGLSDPIINFAKSGYPILGTCAGAIVLASEVLNPVQKTLGLIDITIERNAYGRQVDSFIDEAVSSLEGGFIEAVFIRAPIIRRVGKNVDVLAQHRNDPILVREGNILAATFHPELSNDNRVHNYFISLIE